MCQYCCSHLPARAPAERCGGLQTPLVVGILRIFVLNEPTPFPGELLTLHLWQGGALRLFADVLESARTEDLSERSQDAASPDPDASYEDEEEPLAGVFGIAASADATHGVVARVDTARPGGWERAARRLHVEVLGRYALSGLPWHTGAYSMARVKPLCERAAPAPVRSRALDTAFAPLQVPSLRRIRGVRGARVPRRRPSADLGGLTFATWRSVDAAHLVARARSYSRRFFDSDIDALLSWPDRTACPARWSFWLAAAVRAAADDKLRMLRTTCTVSRLRFLLRILDGLERGRNTQLSSSPLDSRDEPPCKYLRTRFYKPDIPSL